MKKQFKTIVLALLTTTLSFAALAHTTHPDKKKSFEVGMYYDYNSGTIKTFIEKEKGDQLQVTFLNEEGNELSQSFLNKKSESGRVYFDINTLPNGSYSIKVSNGTTETVHPVNISQPVTNKVVKLTE